MNYIPKEKDQSYFHLQQTLNEVAFSTPVPHNCGKREDCVQEMEGGRTKGKVGERQSGNFARIK